MNTEPGVPQPAEKPGGLRVTCGCAKNEKIAVNSRDEVTL
jgi:hypothetical protein